MNFGKTALTLFRKRTGFGLACAAMIASASLAPAQPISNPPVVEYTPSIVQIQGQFPFTQSYQVAITAPMNFSALVGANGSSTISFSVAPTSAMSIPAGVSTDTAVSYVTISPATVSFTSSLQVRTVTITLAVPANAIPGAYGYKILTTGWPVDPLLGLSNNGTFINASVTAPAVQYTPPDVNILTPADGTTISTSTLPLSVPFSFTATSTGASASPITDTTAMIDGWPIALTNLTGLNTTSVSGSGTLSVATAGAHTVVVQSTNLGGSASDTNTFTIQVNAPPPVAVINAPLDGSTYNLRAGGSSLSVPFSFTATSSFGGIQSLTVMLDGVPAQYTSSSLGALVVTGSSAFAYSTSGSHTFTVTATDPNGTSQTATSTFSVNLIAPTPAIAVNLTNGSSYTIPTGATSINIPFTLLSTSTNNFTVDTVTATWSGGSAPALAHTPSLGTASSVSSAGTLLNVGPGTYTINARTTSAGYAATASASFTVAAPLPLPTVTITAPAIWSYTVSPGSPALSLPLTFVGTSNALTGVITNLSATLDGAPLAVSGLLNLKVATGTATLNIPATSGSHVVVVTATDFVGTATASQTLTVTVGSTKNVSGTAFFDVDADGTQNASEFGLAGVSVNLLNSTGAVVATGTTNASGAYYFTGVSPGAYTVSATAPAGMKATAGNTRAITISTANLTAPAIGFGLDFKALQGTIANGFTIGYWKNNLDKAISGKTAGIQVPAASLTLYTTKIGAFALAPYDNITMKQASATMGSTSAAAKDLLSKQLVASEYNYQNGAYLSGNQNLTFCFLYWGEYVLKNSSSYSSTYIIWAKDWFDAYNNSHGGLVAGPN